MEGKTEGEKSTVYMCMCIYSHCYLMFLQKFMASKFLKGKPLHLTLCYNPYEVAKEKKGYGTQMDI